MTSYDDIRDRARELNDAYKKNPPPQKSIHEEELEIARANLDPKNLLLQISQRIDERDDVLGLLVNAGSNERAKEVLGDLAEDASKLPEYMSVELSGPNVFVRILL